MHLPDVYLPDVHQRRRIPRRRASEVHAREMQAREMHELRRCGEIFDLSLSIPISRYIGDAPGAVFGAKLNAKSVTEASDP